MSRKKGSKNSLAKGLDCTVRVWTTLIVTTDGPTRCAAATIDVLRDALGSRPRALSCAGAARGPSRRSPQSAIHGHSERERGCSADDIQSLLGKPSQPGIANPHQ